MDKILKRMYGGEEPGGKAAYAVNAMRVAGTDAGQAEVICHAEGSQIVGLGGAAVEAFHALKMSELASLVSRSSIIGAERMTADGGPAMGMDMIQESLCAETGSRKLRQAENDEVPVKSQIFSPREQEEASLFTESVYGLKDTERVVVSDAEGVEAHFFCAGNGRAYRKMAVCRIFLHMKMQVYKHDSLPWEGIYLMPAGKKEYTQDFSPMPYVQPVHEGRIFR